MKINRLLVLVSLMIVGAAQTARADTTDSGTMGSSSEESRARMGDTSKKDESRTLVRNAADVYRTLVSDPSKAIPQNVLSQARCVAVIPSLVSAALIVGGSHGNGVASCRTKEGKWSPVAFVDMSGGSIGAQIGGKSTDLVLFLLDEEAAANFKRGKFTVGADAGVVAGSYGGTAQVPSKGVVVYQRSGGVFAGASINGDSIEKDTANIKAAYGQDVEFAALLDGRAGVTDDVSQPFTSLLPRQA